MRLIPGGSIHSREYALFNEGAYLVLAGGFGYVLASPSAPTRQALAGPLSVIPDIGWGLLFVGAGAAAVVGAYWPRALRLTRGVLLAVALMWSVVLVAGVGWFIGHNVDSFDLHIVRFHGIPAVVYVDIVPGMVREVVARGLLSALIFGGVASHTSRIIPADQAPDQTPGRSPDSDAGEAAA